MVGTDALEEVFDTSRRELPTIGECLWLGTPRGADQPQNFLTWQSGPCAFAARCVKHLKRVLLRRLDHAEGSRQDCGVEHHKEGCTARCNRNCKRVANNELLRLSLPRRSTSAWTMRNRRISIAGAIGLYATCVARIQQLRSHQRQPRANLDACAALFMASIFLWKSLS